MVISSPCLTDIKNWLVQKQTAFGKDFSNPFIADSLLKTIWFSTHHASHAPCYSNEALAIPEQTATGKEISNLFMAGEDCWVLEDFTLTLMVPTLVTASEDFVAVEDRFEENETKWDLFCTVRIRRIQLSVQYSVLIQLINMAYPLPLDTAYRSSGTETES
ncbi:hypothetical protein Tco_0429041 [Tanacetum coccineum]